jgi:hypothetical protein
MTDLPCHARNDEQNQNSQTHLCYSIYKKSSVFGLRTHGLNLTDFFLFFAALSACRAGGQSVLPSDRIEEKCRPHKAMPMGTKTRERKKKRKILIALFSIEYTSCTPELADIITCRQTTKQNDLQKFISISSAVMWRSSARSLRRRGFSSGPVLNDTAKLKQELETLTSQLESSKKSSSGLVTALGFASALVLVGAFIGETEKREMTN